MAVNRNAQTVHEANQIAITDTVASLNGIANIPATHRQKITADYAALGAAIHLYKSQPTGSNNDWTAVVVEVNTHYACTRGNHTTYTIDCMLDVDIPPEGSTQQPHFGWEVKLDRTRVGNGHIWLPNGLLKVGRPRPGQGLEEYSFEGKVGLQGLGNDGQVVRDCSFRRYR